MSIPDGKGTGWEVFARNDVFIYKSHTPDPKKTDKVFLDMRQFDEHRDWMPVALLSTTNEELLKKDRWYSGGSRYALFKSFETLIKVLEELKPEHRNLSTMVLPNRPCHAYMDLDCDRAKMPNPKQADNVQEVMEAAWSLWAEAFTKTFGRAPNGIVFDPTKATTISPDGKNITNHDQRIEFDACDAKKFSVHTHLCVEAFATVEDQKRFMQGPFFQLVQAAARKGDPRAMRIGYWSKDKPKVCSTLYATFEDKGYFHIFPDLAVYTRYRVFRFPLNAKPGKTKLVLRRGPAGLEKHWKMQVKHALISFTYPTNSEYTFLTCADTSSSSSSRLEFKAAAAAASSSSSSSSVSPFAQRPSGPAPRLRIPADHQLQPNTTQKTVVARILAERYRLHVAEWQNFECTECMLQGYWQSSTCVFHPNPNPSCLLRVQCVVKNEHPILRLRCQLEREQEVSLELSLEQQRTLFECVSSSTTSENVYSVAQWTAMFCNN